MALQSFNIILYIWIGLAVLTFFFLLKTTAPYGRHFRSHWGPTINNRNGWILMEFPALLVFTYFFLSGATTKTPATWIYLVLWATHYLNRTFIFPLRQKTRGKRMPVLIMLSAVIFNFINGYLNGHYLGSMKFYPENWILSPKFLAGLLLFALGLSINWYSDSILLNLRKQNEGGYKLPDNGLFKKISCPNYFGELIEWTGFAVLTWSLPALSFVIWTAANLIPRALSHHTWYKNKFESYPAKRKAVIPFVL